ncbi:DUF4232 domain-containing protein [Streptomyces aurantiogriseus]|uniref:DUF4232 domain-containing protein n=1 Tax=Streptomyces aurantiogriseus TaxID=66870 RepID=UPI0035716040
MRGAATPQLPWQGRAHACGPRPGRAELITLKPGQSAYTRLHWGDVPAAGEPTKAEQNPTRLEVTPPDSVHHLNTAWKLGEVLQKGRIDITPLAKGTGPTF